MPNRKVIMKWQALVFSITTFAVTCIGSAAAQVPSRISLDSGALVRMYTANGVVRGRLVQPFRGTGDPFRYCRYPGPPCTEAQDSVAIRIMPSAALLHLDIQSGTHWRRGLLIGGAIGAALGAVGTALIASGCDRTSCISTNSAAALGGLSGAITIGALGTLWGSAFPRWKAAY